MRAVFVALAFIGACISALFANPSVKFQIPQFRLSNSAALGVSIPTPLFHASFDSSITPEIGSGGTFTRNSIRTYFSDASTISTVTANNPAVGATLAGVANGRGILLEGDHDQYILQSEAPATTWSSVGSPTSINNSVGTFYGSVGHGSIVCTGDGDGIEQQAPSLTVDSDIKYDIRYVASVIAATNSGTVDFEIEIEGTVAGTETGTSTTFVAQGNERRFDFYHEFSGAVSDVTMRILCKEAGTLYIGGMMLEDVGLGGDVSELSVASSYIPSTTSQVATAIDDLTYNTSGHIDFEQGTFTAWIMAPYDNTEIIDPNERKRFFNVNSNVMGFHREWTTAHPNGGLVVAYGSGGNEHYNQDHTFSKDTWYQYAFSWDNRNPNTLIKVYRDGEKVGASYVEDVTTPTGTSFALGAINPTTTAFLFGIMSDVKIYGEPLSDEQMVAAYNKEKGTYAKSSASYSNPGEYAAWDCGESGVVVCWNLDEASGNITDDTAGLTLTATGTLTYSAVADLEWTNYSPGIIFLGSNDYFLHTGASDTAAGMDTDDARVQIVFASNSISTADNMLYSMKDSGNANEIYFDLRPNSNIITVYMTGASPRSVNFAPASGRLNDGSPHFFDVSIDRDGFMTAELDGVAMTGTVDISINSATDMDADHIAIGTYVSNLGLEFDGVIYGVRQSNTLSLSSPFD